MITLTLPAHLERSVLAGHPWIYRDQLPRGFAPGEATWVELALSKVRAYALYDPESALALRVYSRERPPDPALIEARVAAAWALRALWREPELTDAFRLLNGEGDELPGIVVDHYAGHLVVALAAPACERLLPWLVPALERSQPRSIALRGASRRDGVPRSLVALSGPLPPRTLVVRENGLSFHANLHTGQKTGLFLDQRDNRSLVERHARGRRVLNLFSYSGAFSLYAARGLAKSITSVDSAAPAMRDAELNFELNGFTREPHEFLVRDVFEYLEQSRRERRSFDFVICDPPSFGSQKAQLDRALAGYARLFAAALKVTEPGGLIAASSCTARVTPALLTEALALGAKKARVQVQVIADNGHAQDHPICAGHPEGRYLKFLLGRVSARS